MKSRRRQKKRFKNEIVRKTVLEKENDSPIGRRRKREKIHGKMDSKSTKKTRCGYRRRESEHSFFSEHI